MRWLIGLGIVLLSIGSISSFYVETTWFGNFPVREYPYQSIGLVLILAGIAVTSLGAFMGMRKPEPRAIGKFFCQYCGTENDSDAVFCRQCGKKLA